MSSVNIGGTANDRSHRYKMPKLIAKVEGRGNGIKTRIVNMADIAKALHVPPAYPTKFFGFELGAQSRWTEATQAAIVNGAFTAKDLQETLDGFVQLFVLCPGCGLPELDMAVKKGSVIGKCSACGESCSIGGTHKLGKYIINNPPPKPKKGASQAAAAAAKADAEDPFANDLIQLNDEAVPDDEDVEWYTDTSESAVLERQKGTIGSSKLLAEMGAVTIERDIADSVAAFHEWYDGNDRGTDEVVAYLAELKSTYAHADAEIIGAACDVLFNENLLAEMEDLAPILEPYLNGSSAEKVVLGSLERLIGEKHPDELLKFTAHLLKALYENDLVSDDVMIKWGKKKSSKYVRNATSVEVKQAGAQFLTWLEEAEDEYSSYEEDSGDEGGDGDGDDGGAAGDSSQFARGAASIAAAATNDDDDDDFDIDDI